MPKNEFILPSHGEKLHCILWTPENGGIRAVIQIVHGMVEYAARYDETARYLCSRGYSVISHDHPGHGSTASCDGELGYIASPGGSELLTECVFDVTMHAKELFPGAEIFIFGHSMGSFITRRYLTLHGDCVAGAAIIGTGNQSPLTLSFAKALTRLDIRLHGDRHRSKLITFLAFGSYTKRCPHGSPYAWLTTDDELLRQHDADKYSTFVFTDSAYLALFDTLRYLADETGLENIPAELPIYIASGGEDPVGTYGREPTVLASRLRELAHTDVTLKIYEGDRHEIFNERDREKVRADFAAWLDAHTGMTE